MAKIDLSLSSFLLEKISDYDVGASAFLTLLQQMRSVPSFDVDWTAQWSQSGPKLSVSRDKDAFHDAFAAFNSEDPSSYAIWANEAALRLYDVDFKWKQAFFEILLLEIFHPHSATGTAPQHYLDLIRVITGWMRPQHMRMGPHVYLRDHHPLDRQRNGIGWIGWLPFALTPADVPEAHLVQPMNGGTVVMTWPEFWQAHDGARNDDAIRRTQDVEIRLNMLGVLPTNGDIEGGNWGR
jgi:hypothetical protein